MRQSAKFDQILFNKLAVIVPGRHESHADLAHITIANCNFGPSLECFKCFQWKKYDQTV